MADDTHLKLAHNILATAETTPIGAERADKVARSQAYAQLATAEALGRLADVFEAERAEMSGPPPA